MSMNKIGSTAQWGRRLVILASLILCIGLSTTQAFADSILSGVSTTGNNFTMIDASGGGITGGTNDVVFTWDGTKMTSVAVSGQVFNATISSTYPFFGVTWSAHDVAVYGPGTYTVYAGCLVGAPGCGTGTPVTFTVAAGELGAHMLFDWGGSNDIDVVDIWVPNAVFGPSPLYTGPDGTTPPYGNPATVWNWMSSDWNGDGYNGSGMVDGPFVDFNANFNVMGIPVLDCNDNNACTSDAQVGGYCVHTATVPASCNDNNICTTNGCSTATGLCTHTATVPASCNDNNPCTTDGCSSNACTHTNNALPCTDNNICTTIDTCSGGVCVGTAIIPASCNDNNICTTDGCTANACTHTATVPASCEDNNICTTDGCVSNACTHTAVVPGSCNDNVNCTTEGCNTATGLCTHTPVICAQGSCDTATGLCICTTDAHCDDNDICTTDLCNTATGQCYPHTATVPTSCNDNNICTTDGCVSNACTNTAIVPASCEDNNVCTTEGCTSDTCTHVAITCNDNNACTTDSCNSATGCVNTTITCNDNSVCTDDTCNTSTGCVYTNNTASCNDSTACTSGDVCAAGVCAGTTINCNDNNICTVDTCNTSTGCVHTATVPASCNDNNACTTDSCTANECMHTAIGSCIADGHDGDLIGDPKITVADALFALRIAAGLETPTASQLLHGDVAPLVNGVPAPDGVIDMGDVVVILRKALGLVTF